VRGDEERRAFSGSIRGVVHAGGEIHSVGRFGYFHEVMQTLSDRLLLIIPLSRFQFTNVVYDTFLFCRLSYILLILSILPQRLFASRLPTSTLPLYGISISFGFIIFNCHIFFICYALFPFLVGVVMRDMHKPPLPYDRSPFSVL